EEALKLNPDNFSVLKNVLLLYLDSKQYDLAIQKSSESLVKYPSHPIFYLINGVALNELSQTQKAIEMLESGLDWIVDDIKMESDFYIQLSNAYTKLNNTEKAKTFSDKAKKLEIQN